MGIANHHHLYILIQVLVRFLPGSYRREYRPLRNPYPHYTFTQYPLPSTSLSRTFTDPLPLRNTLRTVTDPLSTSANSILTRYETSLTRYTLSSTLHIIYGRPTLYNMADIRQQIKEGQENWRQGVDVTSTEGVDDYIEFKILEYGHAKLMNDDLWEQYREDFADFTEAILKTCNPTAIRNLRTLLRDQGVWVVRDRRITIARSLYNTLCEEDPTEWTKEEIQEQIKATRPFTSFKLNRISGLITNPLNETQTIG